ncbi:ABC transporter permease [SCandidatus Aminicenantes bacterium Aminicenantia_JdfR_composite]|jgi:peptide/nickel transport system permease protein|nr:ABC transporter permease [SCandidatus Aminicenantes bacterium Aminicenantia_JdfR_composite]MCP2597582.1 ABC transporter permease [Candidatus Aminicenantes bacterium AC-335-G13]MCP2597736.1 ABC transporter permease [Candidatus Aminicenantes bacterium AC-335-L06]MCP2620903.1 ABC transporter permease [Candidatus Aminicenantes bacterium AC-334-E05]
MRRFLIKRFITSLIVLWGVSTLIFLLIHLVPGDPVQAMLGESALPSDIENLREKLGLNEPLFVQYKNYFFNLIKGDLGTSIVSGRKVSKEILSRFPATLELAIASILVSILISFPLGLLSALKKNSIWDISATTISTLGLAIPNFWLGPLLIILFSIKLSIFPVSGRGTLAHLVLPAITLGTALSALLTRIVKTSVAEELKEDYVKVALAKGLTKSKVLLKHVLRNALIPIITILALQIGSLLTGAIITETIFSWPGIGRLIINAINQRDYPLVQGVILFIAFIYIITNFLADIFYAIVDPRIRYETKY